MSGEELGSSRHNHTPGISRLYPWPTWVPKMLEPLLSWKFPQVVKDWFHHRVISDIEGYLCTVMVGLSKLSRAPTHSASRPMLDDVARRNRGKQEKVAHPWAPMLFLTPWNYIHAHLTGMQAVSINCEIYNPENSGFQSKVSSEGPSCLPCVSSEGMRFVIIPTELGLNMLFHLVASTLFLWLSFSHLKAHPAHRKNCIYIKEEMVTEPAVRLYKKNLLFLALFRTTSTNYSFVLVSQ